MTTYSGYTNNDVILYTTDIPGGVGLVGISLSPSLQAIINALPALPVFSTPLSAFIRPVQIGETYSVSGGMLYTNQVQGGMGLYGIVSNPDLFGFIDGNLNKTHPGLSDLSGWIIATRSGIEDIQGYIIPTASGSDTLDTSISGVHMRELIGYIRGTSSGIKDLNSFIEPIPPKDLYAILTGYAISSLSGVIEPVYPSDLPSTIYPLSYSELLTTLTGYFDQDLEASYSGCFTSQVSAFISAIASGYKNLSAQYHGFKGINQEGHLNAYIVPLYTSASGIDASISGAWKKDLLASIMPLSTSGQEDLQASYTPNTDNVLIGQITATGGFSNLYGYVLPAKKDATLISALIDGKNLLDLYAQVNAGPQSLLSGVITASGPVGMADLYTVISGFYISDLVSEYEASSGNLLRGIINPIDGIDLYATIQPKTFFIESYLPINTYYYNNLKVMINASACENLSDFSDLQVAISGSIVGDLTASIVGLVGQYAVASDLLPIELKESKIIEDWLFLILKQPIISEDKLPIILTTSPLSDLTASIVGIPHSADLAGSISPIYIPSIDVTKTPIGEWVNTKNGDTKIINMYFQGNATNFYYSRDGQTTYPGNADEYLDIVVETYKNTGEPGTLLNRKVKVKQYKVDKLADFKTIDDAIKFGIVVAASEIHSDLSAYIYAKPNLLDVTASISGIDSTVISDISAKYATTENNPDLGANITVTGGLYDLPTSIQVLQTNRNFIEISGTRYIPTLVPIDDTGAYSVVLTAAQINDTVNPYNTPDLSASVTGIILSDLDATISGV